MNTLPACLHACVPSRKSRSNAGEHVLNCSNQARIQEEMQINVFNCRMDADVSMRVVADQNLRSGTILGPVTPKSSISGHALDPLACIAFRSRDEYPSDDKSTTLMVSFPIVSKRVPPRTPRKHGRISPSPELLKSKSVFSRLNSKDREQSEHYLML